MRGSTAGRAARAAVAVLLLTVPALVGCGADDRPPVAAGSGSASATAPPTTSPPPAPPAPASPPPPSVVPLACAGQDVEVLPTSARVAAITVDLGGDAAGLPPVLQALAAQDVRATFFVTGAFARRHPDGLRQVLAAGHLVGNHTDTHPELPGLADGAVRAQLAAVEDVVLTTTGRTTRPLFRFPFGARDARTLRLVNEAGWCAYRWTVDTLGWKGTSGGSSAAGVVERVMRTLRPGAIVLMHGGANPDDGSTLDAEALPAVLRAVRAAGYGFTTLPQG